MGVAGFIDSFTETMQKKRIAAAKKITEFINSVSMKKQAKHHPCEQSTGKRFLSVPSFFYLCFSQPFHDFHVCLPAPLLSCPGEEL